MLIKGHQNMIYRKFAFDKCDCKVNSDVRIGDISRVLHLFARVWIARVSVHGLVNFTLIRMNVVIFMHFSYRKVLQRQLDTLQQSLEAETKSKNEQIRLKRKSEKELSEMEVQLENADRVNALTSLQLDACCLVML